MGAIQLEKELVDCGLLNSIHVDQLRSDVLIDVVDSLLNTLAKVARLIAITELYGFVCTCGCATWNRSASDDTALEVDIHLNSWVAAGVKDLPGLDGINGTHIWTFFVTLNRCFSIRNAPENGAFAACELYRGGATRD